MNIQAEFDQLIHIVTTTINDILAEAAEKAAEDGNPNYMRDENGNPWQLFVKTIEGDD